MKKVILLILLAALSICMTACVMTGTPGDQPTNPPVDPNTPAQIVLDETKVEQGNCYGEDGSHIGYYRITEGTNCGNEGVVRIEFLDLNEQVLRTFSPTFAGGTLGYGQMGGTTHGYFEITDIWESDYKDGAVNSNSYLLTPYSSGAYYAYIENRAGATVRCELYDADSTVIASLTPVNPQYRLEVERYGQEGYFQVDETYTEERPNGNWSLASRSQLYTATGTLLGQILYSYTDNPEGDKIVISRAEVRNPAGETLRVYEQTAPDFELTVGFNNENVLASEFKYCYDPLSVINTFREDYGLANSMILFREENVYQDGKRIDTKYTAFGGEMVITSDANTKAYQKLELYNASGSLVKTVTAPTGGYLYFTFDSESGYLCITVCDAGNNMVDYHSYKPSV